MTRQFLATNKKVINRGDSFKKKQRPATNKTEVEINIHESEGEDEEIIKKNEDKKLIFLQIISSKRKLTNTLKKSTELLSLEVEKLENPR